MRVLHVIARLNVGGTARYITQLANELPKHGIETLVATGVAFIIGYIVLAWLLKFVSTKSFRPFIIYRVALGSLILVLLATGVINS